MDRIFAYVAPINDIFDQLCKELKSYNALLFTRETTNFNEQVFEMLRRCKQVPREEYREWTLDNGKIVSKAASVPAPSNVNKVKVIADFLNIK